MAEFSGKTSPAQREYGLRLAGKQLDGGASEDLERNHGRGGVARKAEHEGPADAAEHERLAGLNQDPVEIEFSAERCKHRFDDVVFAGRDAAGQQKHVVAEAVFHQRPGVPGFVTRHRKDNGQASGALDLHGQGAGVGVAHLVRPDGRVNVDDFVPGGNDRDTRPAIHPNQCFPDGGQQSNLRKTEAGASGEQSLALAGFGAPRVDEFSRPGRAAGDDRIALARCVLNHHDSVGAVRNRRSCHDFNGLTGAEDRTGRFTGADFTGDRQAPRQVGGTDGIPVADGSRQGRIVPVGQGVPGKHPSVRVFEPHGFRQGLAGGQNAVMDDAARLFERAGGHGGIVATQAALNPRVGATAVGDNGVMRLLLALGLVAAMNVPGAQASSKILPYEYDQHDLPNGLRVVTVPVEFPNAVALYIVAATGSRNEVEPGKSGFAHFFEHMMFRGTKLYPPAKYESTLKQAGADSNAFTSDDLTCYHTTFSKEDLETMLMIEADRFQNLEYTEAAFRTEALAVLGEYNKSSSSPTLKLFEKLHDTAFDKHTYRHTTIGFLADIQDMPNQFDYSKQFFSRWYRPEYTTILVVGDVETAAVRKLVAKYWGNWQRGNYKAAIPPEPVQTGPREAQVGWPSPTLPWLAIAFKAPAYTDTAKDTAALDLLATVGFSDFSPLYRRLVLDKQVVDVLAANNPDHVDPYLFYVIARVKKPEGLAPVREEILNTLNSFKDTLVEAERLEQVKRHLRYQVALDMNSSRAIARRLASYIALRRSPETMNRIYEMYEKVTPEDIREAARKYLTENGRTIVTLTGAGK